ncbi:MAG: ribonuclease HII [Treponema sp.]|nr:ribonuclease HII [Treponema sp.]
MKKAALSKPLLCGIDEAGRGPLAGPVCAAAVILPDGFPVASLGDSKKLSPAAREALKADIYRWAKAWGIGWASPSEIDEINILKASLLAMTRAFYAMKDAAPFPIDANAVHAVVDGTFAPDIPVPCQPMVKADSQIPQVMAASILAKTARDRLMEYYGLFYPQYGYERHKGYPTKAHRQAVARWGPSPIQRMSFSCSPASPRRA